jgi:micrococcal nuclease
MKKVAYLLLLLLLPGFAVGQHYTGKVIAIADGDTFTLLVDQKQLKVRLHGIDTPERGQPYAQAATEYLANLIHNKTVTVLAMDTDRYGRTIGVVKIDTLIVNTELLKAGLAWHYKHYDTNPEWAAFEEEAKRTKTGLWKMPNPVPPWEYRRTKRTEHK